MSELGLSDKQYIFLCTFFLNFFLKFHESVLLSCFGFFFRDPVICMLDFCVSSVCTLSQILLIFYIFVLISSSLVFYFWSDFFLVPLHPLLQVLSPHFWGFWILCSFFPPCLIDCLSVSAHFEIVSYFAMFHGFVLVVTVHLLQECSAQLWFHREHFLSLWGALLQGSPHTQLSAGSSQDPGRSGLHRWFSPLVLIHNWSGPDST